MIEKIGNLHAGDKFVLEPIFHPVNTPLHTVVERFGIELEYVRCERYDGTPEAFPRGQKVNVVFRKELGK